MRIALKFTILFLLGMGLIRGIFSYNRVQREAQLFAVDFRRDHETMGRDLAAAAARIWQLGGEDAAIAFIEEANSSKSDITIAWVRGAPGDAAVPPTGADGGPRESGLADSGASDRTTDVEDKLGRQAALGRVLFIERRAGDERFLDTYVSVRTDQGVWVGTLLLSESMAKAQDYLRSTILRSLVQTLLIAALTAATALLLGFWIVGVPAKQLVSRARQIAAGNFSGKLHLRQSDELGDLGREIDAMSDQLAAANERLASETAARIAAIEQLRHGDRLRTVGQLTSGIAHELGTPLNVVSERAKLIANHPTVDAPSAASARVIIEQAQRMTRIIRQLLDFSRPTRPNKVQVDLRKLLRDTVQLAEPVMNKSHVTARLIFSAAEAIAAVDVEQMKQVVLNLVVNAVQSMRTGGEVLLQAGFRNAAPADKRGELPRWCAFFSVTDQGPGIAADDVPRVFDPFFTTKDVGEGTGLGLSISLGIVQEHGGWIDIETCPGKGSTFTVYLPTDNAKESETCRAEC